MVADVRSLLSAGGYLLPDEDRCAQLQAYWDELSAQSGQLTSLPGDAEPATTYMAWRIGDD